MGSLTKDTFLCLDCESTGLDPENDRMIEVAAVIFTFDNIIDTFETLINPERPIPRESQEIHNISEQMVHNKPKFAEILPSLLKFIDNHIIVGHGIGFDISLIANEVRRTNKCCSIENSTFIDTLRLARLYGDSPLNSLDKLRQHFNLQYEGAHRAMNDVIVNIEVFKKLSTSFKTTEQLLQRLTRPIAIKTMPLGKHKGRKFEDVPAEYLQWAARKNFDQDLLFSIRSELKRRKQGNRFNQASNPFSSL